MAATENHRVILHTEERWGRNPLGHTENTSHQGLDALLQNFSF